MATKRRVPKFRRATPQVRREALIDATLRCLKRYGHEGVSVRRISAAAGVSIGLINHHFPSKSGLVAVTYETLALSLQDSIRAQAENRAVAPRASIERFLPGLVRPGNSRSAAVQRLAGVLEHGGAFARNPRRARSNLRQVPIDPRVDAGPARDLRRSPEIQAAPGGHRAVRLARRAVGGVEPEPDDLQAARGHRAVRGLGQRDCATAPFRGCSRAAPSSHDSSPKRRAHR